MDHNHHSPIKHATYNKHEGHHTEDFLTKFLVAVIITLPIFFYSEMAKELFGVQGPSFPGQRYLLLLMGTFVYCYCGWIFLKSAYQEVKARLPGMMVLITIAITAAYLYSVFSILSNGMHDLLFELASLISIMLLGHYIEMRSVAGAQGALQELSKLLPDTAELVHGTMIHTVNLSELSIGDVIIVKPGSKVPADGLVIEGESNVNESILTGESKPVHKTVGVSVVAGSINGEGSLKVRVETIGEQTFLAGIMRLVAEAQASKSRLQTLSDRAAFFLTGIALTTSTITFVAWFSAGAGIVTATERFVAVLIIACPHALGLAVPLVAAISTTLAAKNGLLVRERIALEGARKIDTVLFDKTGTLTKGEFGVESIFPTKGNEEERVLQLAASVNNHSEHPLAEAIVTEARKKNIPILNANNFKNLTGKGSTATIEGSEVLIGSESLLTENNIELSQEQKTKLEKISAEGKTIIHVIANNNLLGSIALGDTIREESYEAIRSLKAAGIKTAMITGDSEDVARWVSKKLEIDDFFARVLPEQKAEKITLLQSQKRKVAFVGDGVNDAPALTQANLGIAIGAGTNVAIESAGIILVRSDPRDIPKIFNLSRLTYVKMIQNLFWATGYNVVAIPLAAGVLAYRGILLEPWLAAVFMSASTALVALNAILLKTKQLS